MHDVGISHDYSAKLDIKNDDEIGILANSFNAMLVEIRAREHEIVTKLVRAAEYRDTDTGDHIARVARYVGIIAQGLGLNSILCERISLASTMHDIGKISVPDAVLLKQGPLNPEERATMERHVEMGRDILDGSTSDLIQLGSQIAFSHHEKWDGSGYPRELKGEDIPLPARMVAVADVFDALTSERPYKQAWPLGRAREFLQTQAGKHFDPTCVQAFIENWPAVVETYAMTSGVASARHEAPS